MNRLENFAKLKFHPLRRSMFKRLTQADYNMIDEFLREHGAKSNDDYAFAVNRFLLDKPKPKNYSAICTILTEIK